MSIEIKNLSKSYGKTKALDSVLLEFKENKIYALLGRNGAGKSTLLKAVSNRIYFSDGEVLIDGLDSVENDKAQSLVYLMNDENTLPRNMTVKSLIKTLKMFYKDADAEKAEALASRFSLDTKKRFGSLSTGYKTVVRFILAICSGAKYTFLDEPVLGLDAAHRELVYKIIIEEYTRSERCFVIATHIIEEISSVVEHVVLIDKGKVLENDSAENLLKKGYCVSGNEKEVNEFIKDKNVISTEKIGSVMAAYILSSDEIKGEIGYLEISPLSLQKLFVKLTGEEEEK